MVSEVEIRAYLINNIDSVPDLPKVKEGQHWTHHIFGSKKNVYKEPTEGECREAYFESEEFKSVSSPTWEVCMKLWEQPTSFEKEEDLFRRTLKDGEVGLMSCETYGMGIGTLIDVDNGIAFNYRRKESYTSKTRVYLISPSCFNKEEERLIGKAILRWENSRYLDILESENKERKQKDKTERDLLKEKYCD